MEFLGFGYKTAKLGFLTELDSASSANINASGFPEHPAPIQQMGAAGTFLGQVKVFIKINTAIRAGINAIFTAGAFFDVNDNQPVRTAVYAAVNGTGWHTRSIITMLARRKHVGHLNLRTVTPDILVHLAPELAGVGLGFGIGHPVIAAVFIFTRNLAGIAAHAA
jgi:hypothetical protein